MTKHEALRPCRIIRAFDEHAREPAIAKGLGGFCPNRLVGLVSQLSLVHVDILIAFRPPGRFDIPEEQKLPPCLVVRALRGVFRRVRLGEGGGVVPHEDGRRLVCALGGAAVHDGIDERADRQGGVERAVCLGRGHAVA